MHTATSPCKTCGGPLCNTKCGDENLFFKNLFQTLQCLCFPLNEQKKTEKTSQLIHRSISGSMTLVLSHSNQTVALLYFFVFKTSNPNLSSHPFFNPQSFGAISTSCGFIMVGVEAFYSRASYGKLGPTAMMWMFQ